MALELARVIQKCTRSALEVDMEKWTWRNNMVTAVCFQNTEEEGTRRGKQRGPPWSPEKG